MASAGKVVLRDTGKRGIRGTGKTAVFDSGGACPDCCGPCVPRYIYIQSVSNTPPPTGFGDADLTPYQGPGVGSGNTHWSSFAVGPFPHKHQIAHGCIGPDGTLLGLPAVYVNDAIGSYENFYLVAGCAPVPPAVDINWGGLNFVLPAPQFVCP